LKISKPVRELEAKRIAAEWPHPAVSRHLLGRAIPVLRHSCLELSRLKVWLCMWLERSEISGGEKLSNYLFWPLQGTNRSDTNGSTTL
jgi:hypothetical protein